MTIRRSGLAAVDRYGVQAQLLEDPDLSAWFLEVAEGRVPSKIIDDATMTLLEAHGIIRRTEFGPVLGSEGRLFARDLEIALPPSPVEIDPVAVNQDPRRRLEPADLARAWREYKRHPTESGRNQLIAHYLDLVREVANRTRAKLPAEIEVEDLESAGLFGLMDAVDAFDPNRGVRFELYATMRIRGAMFDELRMMDWVPRLMRSRAARVDQVRAKFNQEHGRAATDDELCEALGISREQLTKTLRDSRHNDAHSLIRGSLGRTASGESLDMDVLSDRRQEDPAKAAQRSDLKRLITKGLTRAERLIVILYYYEEMTMKEIGATLDLSESRVSQMHSSILARLKAQMRPEANDA